MKRHRFAVGALAVLVVLAGCGGVLSGRFGPAGSEDGVPEGSGNEHLVQFVNENATAREATVTVTREGTVAYEMTVEIPANGSRAAVPFDELALRENDRVVVSVEVDGETREAAYRVDDCRGSYLLRWNDRGGLTATYRAC